MLKIYLRNSIRSLLRFKGFSIINLVGLTLGFSAVMVMGVMLYQYLTANGQFANKERMYYVKAMNPDGSTNAYMPYPFLNEAVAKCPDIEAATHLQQWYFPWLKVGQKEFQDQTYFVDSGFFKVFSFPLETGDAASAFRDKYSVVLSHDMAVKFFGSAAAAQGRTVQIDDSRSGTVTAVMQPVPTNTTIRPEVLLTSALLADAPGFKETADWYNTFSQGYVLLRRGADTARVNRQFAGISQLKFDPAHRATHPYLAPYSHYVQEESASLSKVVVRGISGSILFILLVVVANLLNLNAASSMSRQKELAVRKMMGSGRMRVIMQFVVENAILVFASTLLAFWLFRTVLMPAMNDILRDKFGAISLHISHDYPLLGIGILAGLAIVVLAGSIPGFHFGSLRPGDAIKGYMLKRRERHVVRDGFIVLQFVLATVFIGVAIILNSQIDHMKTASLGFDKDQVLVAPLDLAFRNQKAAESRFDALLKDLRNDPGVEGISTSYNIPTRYDENYNGFVDPLNGREVTLQQGATDDGMLPTYRIKLLAGKDFDGSNDSLMADKIIINHHAAEMFGWKDPVGHQLREKGDNKLVTVIGVMDDFHYNDLSRDIQPLVNQFGGHQRLGYSFLSVRVALGHESEVIGRLQAGFHDMPSRRAFSYEYMSDRVNRQYTFLEGILGATNYVALLTVIVAAMGLFGLIAAFTQRRVKEVGIRKVLGASAGDIIGLLSRSYLILITVALVIAAPIVAWVMHGWLQDFAYRVSIEWWMLAGAGLIALAIGVVTIGFHAVRAARANPVESLRVE
jgi:putative ABC transport system permease protein